MIANSEIDGKNDNNDGSKKRGKKFSINVTKMGDLVRKKDGFIELRKKNETKAIDEQK